MFNKFHFIKIPKSKTQNGIRNVPLHDFVYRKLDAYIIKNKLSCTDYIFADKKFAAFKKANLDLGLILGYDKNRLKTENIIFYSGRHFWKTMMSIGGLGDDVEEYFMGHSVTGDVKKLYDHKDKIGRKNLLEKTKKVFSILDKYIFLNK